MYCRVAWSKIHSVRYCRCAQTIPIPCRPVAFTASGTRVAPRWRLPLGHERPAWPRRLLGSPGGPLAMDGSSVTDDRNITAPPNTTFLDKWRPGKILAVSGMLEFRSYAAAACHAARTALVCSGVGSASEPLEMRAVIRTRRSWVSMSSKAGSVLAGYQGWAWLRAAPAPSTLRASAKACSMVMLALVDVS